MSVKCIDVSTWQSGVDYAKVKAAGIGAAIIRAGYGREAAQKDNRFETHYRNAKAAGLAVGAYWYSYADSVADAEREANACVTCVKGKTFDLPIYFDMEENSQAKLGKATLTAIAKKFCDTIRKSGFEAGVYANLNWFRNYLDYAALKAQYSIWLAQWSNVHSLDCDIWQYADNGTVSGVSGLVDLNVILNSNVMNGSADDGGKTQQAGTSIVAAEKTAVAKSESATVKLCYLASAGYQNQAAQVKTVQRLLNALGCKGKNGGVLTVDGIFGVNTDYAVKSFQRQNKAAADGIVGAVTWKLLLGAA